MITSRERVIRTLNQQPVDRAPRDLWVSPECEQVRSGELAELRQRFRFDFEPAEAVYPRGRRAKGRPCEPGSYCDAWGCTWHVTEPGTIGVPGPAPLESAEQLAAYAPPWELLESARWSRVNRACAATSRFVLASTETSPFARLRLLCGAETACKGIAAGDRTIRALLAALHGFYCREMTLWAESDVDGVAFGDDLACEPAPSLTPKRWRQFLKPLYREYCQILHERDKFAFFRAGGDVGPLLADLVEIGVDALHCPLLNADLTHLAEQFGRRIAFWGLVDPQQVVQSGRPDSIRVTVARFRRALDSGHGGLIAQAHWCPQVPFKNLVALFDQWLQPLPPEAAVAPVRRTGTRG